MDLFNQAEFLLLMIGSLFWRVKKASYEDNQVNSMVKKFQQYCVGDGAWTVGHAGFDDYIWRLKETYENGSAPAHIHLAVLLMQYVHQRMIYTRAAGMESFPGQKLLQHSVGTQDYHSSRWVHRYALCQSPFDGEEECVEDILAFISLENFQEGINTFKCWATAIAIDYDKDLGYLTKLVRMSQDRIIFSTETEKALNTYIRDHLGVDPYSGNNIEARRSQIAPPRT